MHQQEFFVLQMLYGAANLSSRGNGYLHNGYGFFDNNVTKYGIHCHKDRNSLFVTSNLVLLGLFEKS